MGSLTELWFTFFNFRRLSWTVIGSVEGSVVWICLCTDSCRLYNGWFWLAMSYGFFGYGQYLPLATSQHSRRVEGMGGVVFVAALFPFRASPLCSGGHLEFSALSTGAIYFTGFLRWVVVSSCWFTDPLYLLPCLRVFETSFIYCY